MNIIKNFVESNIIHDQKSKQCLSNKLKIFDKKRETFNFYTCLACNIMDICENCYLCCHKKCINSKTIFSQKFAVCECAKHNHNIIHNNDFIEMPDKGLNKNNSQNCPNSSHLNEYMQTKIFVNKNDPKLLYCNYCASKCHEGQCIEILDIEYKQDKIPDCSCLKKEHIDSEYDDLDINNDNLHYESPWNNINIKDYYIQCLGRNFTNDIRLSNHFNFFLYMNIGITTHDFTDILSNDVNSSKIIISLDYFIKVFKNINGFNYDLNLVTKASSKQNKKCDYEVIRFTNKSKYRFENISLYDYFFNFNAIRIFMENKALICVKFIEIAVYIIQDKIPGFAAITEELNLLQPIFKINKSYFELIVKMSLNEFIEKIMGTYAKLIETIYLYPSNYTLFDMKILIECYYKLILSILCIRNLDFDTLKHIENLLNIKYKNIKNFDENLILQCLSQIYCSTVQAKIIYLLGEQKDDSVYSKANSIFTNLSKRLLSVEHEKILKYNIMLNKSNNLVKYPFLEKNMYEYYSQPIISTIQINAKCMLIQCLELFSRAELTEEVKLYFELILTDENKNNSYVNDPIWNEINKLRTDLWYVKVKTNSYITENLEYLNGILRNIDAVTKLLEMSENFYKFKFFERHFFEYVNFLDYILFYKTNYHDIKRKIVISLLHTFKIIVASSPLFGKIVIEIKDVVGILLECIKKFDEEIIISNVFEIFRLLFENKVYKVSNYARTFKLDMSQIFRYLNSNLKSIFTFYGKSLLSFYKLAFSKFVKFQIIGATTEEFNLLEKIIEELKSSTFDITSIDTKFSIPILTNFVEQIMELNTINFNKLKDLIFPQDNSYNLVKQIFSLISKLKTEEAINLRLLISRLHLNNTLVYPNYLTFNLITDKLVLTNQSLAKDMYKSMKFITSDSAQNLEDLDFNFKMSLSYNKENIGYIRNDFLINDLFNFDVLIDTNEFVKIVKIFKNNVILFIYSYIHYFFYESDDWETDRIYIFTTLSKIYAAYLIKILNKFNINSFEDITELNKCFSDKVEIVKNEMNKVEIKKRPVMFGKLVRDRDSSDLNEKCIVGVQDHIKESLLQKINELIALANEIIGINNYTITNFRTIIKSVLKTISYFDIKKCYENLKILKFMNVRTEKKNIKEKEVLLETKKCAEILKEIRKKYIDTDNYDANNQEFVKKSIDEKNIESLMFLYLELSIVVFDVNIKKKKNKKLMDKSYEEFSDLSDEESDREPDNLNNDNILDVIKEENDENEIEHIDVIENFKMNVNNNQEIQNIDNFKNELSSNIKDYRFSKVDNKSDTQSSKTSLLNRKKEEYKGRINYELMKYLIDFVKINNNYQILQNKLISNSSYYSPKLFFILKNEIPYLMKLVIISFKSFKPDYSIVVKLDACLEFVRLQCEGYNKYFQTVITYFIIHKYEDGEELTFIQLLFSFYNKLLKLMYKYMLQCEIGSSFFYYFYKDIDIFSRCIQSVTNILIEITQGNFDSNYLEIYSKKNMFSISISIDNLLKVVKSFWKEKLPPKTGDEIMNYFNTNKELFFKYVKRNSEKEINTAIFKYLELLCIVFEESQAVSYSLNILENINFKTICSLTHIYFKNLCLELDLFLFDNEKNTFFLNKRILEDIKNMKYVLKNGQFDIGNYMIENEEIRKEMYKKPFFKMCCTGFKIIKYIEDFNSSIDCWEIFLKSFYNEEIFSESESELIYNSINLYSKVVHDVEISYQKINVFESRTFYNYSDYFNKKLVNSNYEKIFKEDYEKTYILKLYYITPSDLFLIDPMKSILYIIENVKEDRKENLKSLIRYSNTDLVKQISTKSDLIENNLESRYEIYEQVLNNEKYSIIISLLSNIFLILSSGTKYENSNLNFTFNLLLNLTLILNLAWCSFCIHNTYFVKMRCNKSFAQDKFYLRIYELITNYRTQILIFISVICILSLLGMKYLLPFQMFTIFRFSPVLKNLIFSIRKKYKDFLSALILIIFIVLFYSAISIYMFTDVYVSADGESICNNLFNCFFYLIENGLRSGNGFDFPIKKVSDIGYFKESFADLSFYFIVILIMSNIFNAIIVDLFNKVNDEDENKLSYISNTCIICNLTRSELKVMNIDYDEHVLQNHFMNKYIYYFYYLSHQDNLDLSRHSLEVKRCLENESVVFFPYKGTKL